MKIYQFIFLILLMFSGCINHVDSKRKSISLNGEWHIAQTFDDKIPSTFEHKVPVPGMVDLATPDFDSVGVNSGLRNYFWYKTKFNASTEGFDLAILKLHKTKYGLKAWLNRNEVGESMLNFTPSKWIDRQHIQTIYTCNRY